MGIQVSNFFLSNNESTLFFHNVSNNKVRFQERQTKTGSPEQNYSKYIHTITPQAGAVVLACRGCYRYHEPPSSSPLGGFIAPLHHGGWLANISSPVAHATGSSRHCNGPVVLFPCRITNRPPRPIFLAPMSPVTLVLRFGRGLSQGNELVNFPLSIRGCWLFELFLVLVQC